MTSNIYKTEKIRIKGLTFGSLLTLNCVCFSGFLAIVFLLTIVVNIFMPSSIVSTPDGIEASGFPAIGLSIVLYPFFVLGLSINMSLFMYIGQKIFTKFRDFEIKVIRK